MWLADCFYIVVMDNWETEENQLLSKVTGLTQGVWNNSVANGIESATTLFFPEILKLVRVVTFTCVVLGWNVDDTLYTYDYCLNILDICI